MYASPHGGSLAGSRSSSRGPTPPLAQTTVVAPVVLSESTARKVEGVVKEYLSQRDLQVCRMFIATQSLEDPCYKLPSERVSLQYLYVGWFAFIFLCGMIQFGLLIFDLIPSIGV